MEDTRKHTQESAAKAIEMLEGWKKVHDEYMAARAASRFSEPDTLKAAWELEDEHEKLRDAVVDVMVHDVFDFSRPETPDYMRHMDEEDGSRQCIAWIMDDYDGLLADLKDIANGDF